MTITVTPQTIITAAALVGAVVALILYLTKAVNWFNKQNGQSDDIKKLNAKHNEDIKKLEEKFDETIKKLEEKFDENNRAIQKELSIITRGQLACLKGLQEKGCNGPVKKAVDELEEYLNDTAHEQ